MKNKIEGERKDRKITWNRPIKLFLPFQYRQHTEKNPNSQTILGSREESHYVISEVISKFPYSYSKSNFQLVATVFHWNYTHLLCYLILEVLLGVCDAQQKLFHIHVSLWNKCYSPFMRWVSAQTCGRNQPFRISTAPAVFASPRESTIFVHLFSIKSFKVFHFGPKSSYSVWNNVKKNIKCKRETPAVKSRN